MCTIISQTSPISRVEDRGSGFGDINPIVTSFLGVTLGHRPDGNNNFNIFRNSLGDIEITQVNGHTIIKARTQLATDSPTVFNVAFGLSGRNEIHGVHTLPACFDLANAFLNTGDSLEKLTELKFVVPIVRELDLIAYYDKKPDLSEYQGRELALEACFKTRQGKIFVKGYHSDVPVTRAVDMPTDFLVEALRDASRPIAIKGQHSDQFTIKPNTITYEILGEQIHLPSVRQYLMLEQITNYYIALKRSGYLQPLELDTNSRYSTYISRFRDCDIPSMGFFNSGVMSLNLEIFHDTTRTSSGTIVQEGIFTMTNQFTNETCRGTINTAMTLKQSFGDSNYCPLLSPT